MGWGQQEALCPWGSLNDASWEFWGASSVQLQERAFTPFSELPHIGLCWASWTGDLILAAPGR